MSSTRHAKAGMPPRQERFASSYDRGLLANLVAKRCSQIDNAGERTPIWFLQWLSWQPGGLRAHLREIFPAKEFQNEPDDDLEKELVELCLDPFPEWTDELITKKWTAAIDRTWKFAKAYRLRWIEDQTEGVVTDIGRRIGEAIEYARESRSLALVDGNARIGKSFAARECCHRSGGILRYVQVPASNDDFSFFRSLAIALGVSSSLQSKAQELRIRVEETLQGGGIGIVFDEAHYCFDSFLRSTSLPTRVNWIMTALVNYEVPVVLVTTPQFHKAQARVEKSTGWTSEQFLGRIGHIERLPDSLPDSDLIAVARVVYPEGDSRSWRALAAYADLSKKYLAAIKALANRARWHARQAGRPTATSGDLSTAMREGVLPVESDLMKSLSKTKPAKSPPSRASHAMTPPASRETVAGLRSVPDKMISAGRRETVPNLVE